jgi:hypothetical protein
MENFLSEEFPNVSPKEVYKIISKLAEPRHRHDDEDDEEEASLYSSKKDISYQAPRKNPTDDFLRTNKIACINAVMCKSCTGQGSTKAGVCSNCTGTGRTSRETKFKDPKSGLKIAIDLRNPTDRNKINRFLGTRIASEELKAFHNVELMKFLIQNDIPFATTEKRHPFYRKAKLNWTPVNWNVFENVPWQKLPWSIKASVQALGLGRKLDRLTLRKFAAALQQGNPVIQQKTGRTAQEIIQELNDFVMNEGRSGHRISVKKKITAEILEDKKNKRTANRVRMLLNEMK